MGGGIVLFLVICLFFLIGGPPRKFRYKFLDLFVALTTMALFAGCLAGSYVIGKKTPAGDAAVFGGLIVFWLVISIYKYLRTPKHLRSKRFR